jgi:hypothetical protein
MTLLRVFSNLCVAACLLAGLAGCGAPTPTGEIVDTVPASGILTYQGDPLPYHKVTVMPEGGRPAMGVSDEIGLFTLGTNDAGDGAEVGTHPVAVAYVGPPSDDPEEGVMKFTPPPPPEVKIDRKYTNPATSGLTVEIPAGGTSALALDLE